MSGPSVTSSGAWRSSGPVCVSGEAPSTTSPSSSGNATTGALPSSVSTGGPVPSPSRASPASYAKPVEVGRANTVTGPSGPTATSAYSAPREPKVASGREPRVRRNGTFRLVVPTTA